jgi:hypothetical protein
MIWSGAGLHGTMLACYLVYALFGIDPDESGAKFFLVLAPILFIFGILLNNLAYNLHILWTDENHEKGNGYKFNKFCSALKCDFSVPPAIFFIPMPFLPIVSLIISFVIWIGVICIILSLIKTICLKKKTYMIKILK